MRELFIQLVRLGVGTSNVIPTFDSVDWAALIRMANKQSLLGVLLDGMDLLPKEFQPSNNKDVIFSIGKLLKIEAVYQRQNKMAEEMARQCHNHGIRTYVLKGAVVAECYPKPEHRRSVDLDCYLVAESGDEEVWERANKLMEEQGYKVKRDYYKNSTIVLPGLTVENHRFFTPFRGNVRLKKLEQLLQGLMAEDKGLDVIENTFLFRPPVTVSALFLIEHSYSHFLHEGLTWRLVLDWMLFSRRHQDEIDWPLLEAKIDECGFRKFYDSFVKLGRYLLGELEIANNSSTGLSTSFGDQKNRDLLMLEDIWAPLDLHESVTGWRGKLALASNTWRARWKYSQFTDMSWLQALWIQVKGVLFEKNPKI